MTGGSLILWIYESDSKAMILTCSWSNEFCHFVLCLKSYTPVLCQRTAPPYRLTIVNEEMMFWCKCLFWINLKQLPKIKGHTINEWSEADPDCFDSRSEAVEPFLDCFYGSCSNSGIWSPLVLIFKLFLSSLTSQYCYLDICMATTFFMGRHHKYNMLGGFL